VSEDFNTKLSRWSQRKLAARRGGAADDIADDALRRSDVPAGETPVASVDANAAGQPADANAAADEAMPELPPIDELDAQSDYKVFLSEKVPEAIRRAALRKLWASDPVFANLDKLNDYDDDYNIIDTLITAAQTSYKVGKGHFDEAAEKLEAAKKEAEKKEAEKVAAADEQQPVTAGESAHEPAASEAAEGPERLGDSDAPGDSDADAPQQVGVAEDDNDPGGQARNKDI